VVGIVATMILFSFSSGKPQALWFVPFTLFSPVAIGVWLFWHFSAVESDRRLARRMKSSEPAEAGTLPRAKLVGLVRGAVLRAPVDQKEALAYELVIERDAGRENWTELAKERAVSDFTILVGDQPVLVRGAALDLRRLSPIVAGSLTTRLWSVLERHGISTSPALPTIRFRQWALPPNARVAIVGVVRRELDPSANAAAHPREAPTRMVVESSAQHPSFVVDDQRALR
jgi:hypothetical protein